MFVKELRLEYYIFIKLFVQEIRLEEFFFNSEVYKNLLSQG